MSITFKYKLSYILIKIDTVTIIYLMKCLLGYIKGNFCCESLLSLLLYWYATKVLLLRDHLRGSLLVYFMYSFKLYYSFYILRKKYSNQNITKHKIVKRSNRAN